MKCPYCNEKATEVVETRDSEEVSVVRRRRECIKCGKRFTTYERVEMVPLLVIKKNGSRENFEREKLWRGIAKASEKTAVTHQDVELIVSEIERELRGADTIEIQSRTIGELVAKRLKKKDKVAYIRFASVFKQFVDLEEFDKELKKLI